MATRDNCEWGWKSDEIRAASCFRQPVVRSIEMQYADSIESAFSSEQKKNTTYINAYCQIVVTQTFNHGHGESTFTGVRIENKRWHLCSTRVCYWPYLFKWKSKINYLHRIARHYNLPAFPHQRHRHQYTRLRTLAGFVNDRMRECVLQFGRLQQVGDRCGRSNHLAKTQSELKRVIQNASNASWIWIDV